MLVFFVLKIEYFNAAERDDVSFTHQCREQEAHCQEGRGAARRPSVPAVAVRSRPCPLPGADAARSVLSERGAGPVPGAAVPTTPLLRAARPRKAMQRARAYAAPFITTGTAAGAGQVRGLRLRPPLPGPAVPPPPSWGDGATSVPPLPLNFRYRRARPVGGAGGVLAPSAKRARGAARRRRGARHRARSPQPALQRWGHGGRAAQQPAGAAAAPLGPGSPQQTAPAAAPGAVSTAGPREGRVEPAVEQGWPGR